MHGRGTLKQVIIILVLLIAGGGAVFAQAGDGQNESAAHGADPPQEQAGSAQNETGVSGRNRTAAPPDERELTFGEEADNESPQSVSSFGIWDLVRMVAVLAAVVGGIYLVFYFLKRAAAQRYREGGLIRHLGSLTLPGSKYVHVIEVGRQLFLVGTGDGGVRLISELTDQETIDEVRLKAAEQQGTSSRPFGEMLRSVLGAGRSEAGESRSHGEASAAAGGAGFDFLKQQRERLRKL